MPILNVKDVVIGKRLRKVDQKKVDELIDSIERVGLINPISVNQNKLIAGAHRLEAYKQLGFSQIACIAVGDVNHPDVLRLIEIDENLIRNELSPSEKNQHISDKKDILVKRSQIPVNATGICEKNKVGYTEKRKIVCDKAQAEKEAKEQIAMELGHTNTTNVIRAIKEHKAVEDAGLDQDKLKDLNYTQLKRVAAVAKKKGSDAAKDELLEQLTKPDGESAVSHDKNARLVEDIRVLSTARNICNRVKKSETSDLGIAYCEDVIETITSLVDYLKGEISKN